MFFFVHGRRPFLKWYLLGYSYPKSYSKLILDNMPIFVINMFTSCSVHVATNVVVNKVRIVFRIREIRFAIVFGNYAQYSSCCIFLELMVNAVLGEM